MRTAKIVSRKFARQGGIVFTLEETTKLASADGKTPAEVKERTCMFTQEQIQTAQLIGVKIPAPNDIVVIEDSVNPATGAINEQWVNISL